jgi:hypothetical protein
MSDETLTSAEVTPGTPKTAQPSVESIREEAEQTRLRTELLKQQARKAGILPVNDSMDFDDFVRTRDAAEKEGIKTRFEGDQQPADSEASAGEANAEPDKAEAEPANAADPFTEIGIDEAHPHRQRVSEAKEYYGDQVVNAVAERLSRVPVAPGVARMIADFDNSADMLVELAKHPQPEEIATALSLMPRAKAQQFLQEVSDNLRGSRQETIPTKAPKPLAPISKSSATDQGLHDGLDWKEWKRRREASMRK